MSNQSSAKQTVAAKQQNKIKKIKKAKRIISNGQVHITASFNNTLVYITDLEGNVLTWATAGGMGFKGSRKSTPYAAQVAANKAAQDAKALFNLKEVDVYINGPGPGRESAVRALSKYLLVKAISDVTGIPHNGCREPKERRV